MSGILFGSLAGFFFLGMPIAFCLGMASLIGILVKGSIPLALIAQRIYEGSDSFPLLAVPLFLLAGSLMDTGGISKRLVSFASALVGRIGGGLAIASIIASMFFAGISGAAVADAAAIGVIMIPAMLSRKYDKDFVVGIQSAASSIGVIIPPSIPMVIFGVAAELSIGKLFLGGLVPGLLMGVILMVVSFYMAKRRGWPLERARSRKEIWEAFRSAIWALIMPLIIMGGIIAGIFTATEAAVVAVVYGMFVGIFIYRELKFADLPRIFIDSAVNTATVMIVIASASLFAWVLTSFQIPQAVVNFMQSVAHSKGLLLFLLNILLLIVGTFLDTGSAIIILTPVLLPLIKSFGIDPIHFGVLMVVNLAVGMLTPPYGVTLFACAGIADIPIEKTFKALLPIWLCMLFVVALVTIFPSLVTFVPNLLMN